MRVIQDGPALRVLHPLPHSARGAFIMSLRAEFERRGIDISAIADQSSISVNNQVILLKNKVHVINNN